MTLAAPDRTVEDLLRELAPQVLGVLARGFGDFATAEDAVQEALLTAATQWPAAGLPDNPRGWLVQVAYRRMIELVRAEAARRDREGRAARREGDDRRTAPAADEPLYADRDDTLILLFLCCHPTLSTASAIALTLRAVGGLTTGEIARAFLVPEATMAQRISRAKQRIRTSGLPFRLPDEGEREARLAAVLHVLYLISSPSTRCWNASPATRWSRSTGRWPPRWCTARPPGWRPSPPWLPTPGWPATTASTPPGPTCTRWPATGTGRSPTTRLRRAPRPACRAALPADAGGAAGSAGGRRLSHSRSATWRPNGGRTPTNRRSGAAR